MAITRGYTFGATEQVTNAKLHTLVDSATISAIVNNDIDANAQIAETKINFDGSTVCKLATTQTVSGNKTFSGLTDINNLIGSFASLPSARIGTLNSDLINASLASINDLIVTSISGIPRIDNFTSSLASITSLNISSLTGISLYSPYQAGDSLVISADTERSTSSDTYNKKKDISLIGAGTLRIEFDIKSGNGNTAYGRVYKNDVAIGSEQTTTSTSYVTKSEDISGWENEDLCQLYIKVPTVGSDTTWIRNFRLYSATEIVNTD